MFELIKECFGIRSASLANYLRLSVDMMNSVLSNRRGLDLEQWWAVTDLHEALKKDTALEELEHIVSFRTEQVAIAQQHLPGEIRKLERMPNGERRSWSSYKKSVGRVYVASMPVLVCCKRIWMHINANGLN